MGLHPNTYTQSILVSYEAESALTEGYAVIAGTADDQVDVPGSANDQAVGISRYTRALGEQAEIVIFGPVKAVAGAAITRGALCAMDANGKLVAITPGVTTADLRVVGKALTTADADGDHFTLFVGANDFIAV